MVEAPPWSYHHYRNSSQRAYRYMPYYRRQQQSLPTLSLYHYHHHHHHHVTDVHVNNHINSTSTNMVGNLPHNFFSPNNNGESMMLSNEEIQEACDEEVNLRIHKKND